MYANVASPSDKAAWITAISKESEVAVVAGCADVIRPCDVAKQRPLGQLQVEHRALVKCFRAIVTSSKTRVTHSIVRLPCLTTPPTVMVHSKTLMSPAQALLRVFCQKAPAQTTQSQWHHKARIAEQRIAIHVRYIVSMRPRNYASNNISKAPMDQFPGVNRDAAIMAQYIRMPTPDGGLSPPESLRSAMSRVRQGTEHLVQISKVDDDGIAICRIMTRAELLKQKRDKEKMQKEHKKSLKQSVPKQIELNWAIGPNDLEHKLSQLKGFIEDGKKVEVVLASKKRQRQATPEEAREVLSKVRAKLAEADGREITPMQGNGAGKHTVLTMRKKGLE